MIRVGIDGICDRTSTGHRARGESRRCGTVWVRTNPGERGLRYKIRQEVMEQLFKVNQPNISLSVAVNRFLPCTHQGTAPAVPH